MDSDAHKAMQQVPRLKMPLIVDDATPSSQVQQWMLYIPLKTDTLFIKN